MFKNYALAWSNYSNFSGKATRAEFWSFVLMNQLLLLGVSVSLIFFPPGSEKLLDIITIIWALLFFIPTLAVGIRRMHDICLSGWWFGGLFVARILHNLLSTITKGMASEAFYAHAEWILSGILLWFPGVVVIILCCLKSGHFANGRSEKVSQVQ